MKLARILVATDFSAAGQRAVRLAAIWAARRRAALRIVHVTPPAHLNTAQCAAACIGLGVIGILARGSQRLAPFRIVARLILLGYAIAARLLSAAGR